MRIGIDISQIVHQGTGVSTYTQELVKALLSLDHQNDYVLFGFSLRKISYLKAFANSLGPKSNFVSKFFPIPPTAAEKLLNHFPRPNIELFTGKLDVLHTSDWLEPRANCPKVTVVHDLAMFKFPHVAHPKILATHKKKLELVKKESQKVIAVSESTKKDLVEMLNFDPAKITIIYEAADQLQPESHPEKTLQKYGVKGKYILALGTREPRKNLDRIIQAFTLLKDKDLKLVIVGKFGWGEDVKPLDSVIITGYIPDEDLSAFYSGAQVFAYPSLYEGFGQPILEAMRCGVPVVSSTVSSLPEVAGEAAILVDPTSVQAIAGGIEEASRNRSALIAKGKKQAEKFSWKKAAVETLEVYKKAAGEV